MHSFWLFIIAIVLWNMAISAKTVAVELTKLNHAIIELGVENGEQ